MESHRRQQRQAEAEVEEQEEEAAKEEAGRREAAAKYAAAITNVNAAAAADDDATATSEDESGSYYFHPRRDPLVFHNHNSNNRILNEQRPRSQQHRPSHSLDYSAFTASTRGGDVGHIQSSSLLSSQLSSQNQHRPSHSLEYSTSTTSTRAVEGGHHVRSSSLLSSHLSSLFEGWAAQKIEDEEEEDAVCIFGTTGDQSSLPSSVFPHYDLEHEHQKLTAAAAAVSFTKATQQQPRDTTRDRTQQPTRTRLEDSDETAAIDAADRVRPAWTIYNPSYYTYVASSSSYQHNYAAATQSTNVYRPTTRLDPQQQQQRVLLPSYYYGSHKTKKKGGGGTDDEEFERPEEGISKAPSSSWSLLVRYILSPRVLVTALVLGLLVFNLLPSFGGAGRVAKHRRPHRPSRNNSYRRPRPTIRSSSIQMESIGNSNGNVVVTSTNPTSRLTYMF